MSKQPTQTKKKMSWKKKLLLWVGGLIAGFIILGIAINIADPEGMAEIRAEQEAERQAKESQKAEEDAAKAEVKASEDAAEASAKAAEEATKNDPLNLIAEAADVDGLVVSQKGGRITADFPIADNLSMRLIQRGAQNDTIDILKAVSEHAPAKYDDVLVLGGMDMQDAYGQVTEGQKVLQAEYSKETIGKINFENVFPESIWELRDFGFIHKVLRETE